ncbi:hypothetical protein B0H17DRAFT_1136956 [Mycena rosella]|uniref:Uncharacterized protein n=1 Tax=Mycena rosella TaxID=1033263 RepID=A0AAD7DD09_MYCRO|nr:hypothetical protein B0H17DRAFT_1136956 [Mycena rosella]
MFYHCNNFTIAGGTFNVWERPHSPPSDFRSIRLGDLNLLMQIGNEEALTSDSDVIERRGPALVRRKVIIGIRNVYRARIFCNQDVMTAVVYEGSHGRLTSKGANHCEYIEYQMSDGWPWLLISTDLIPWEISVTPGTRDIEQQLISRMDVCDLSAILFFHHSIPRSIEFSGHNCIAFGKLATVGGDLLDFQIHFPDSECSKFELSVHPWRAYSTPIGTDITALDMQWTRTKIAVPAGSEKDLNFVSYSLIPGSRYMKESWISQPPRLLESGIATGVKLDDLLLIYNVDLSMRLHYPAQSTDSASNLPYLFVSSLVACAEEDGTGWINIQPPRSTILLLGEDLASQLSLPEVTFTVEAYGYSWTTVQYELLRKFHELKGVN